MKIAICDDDKSFVNKLENYFDKYCDKFCFKCMVEVFYNAEDLLKMLNKDCVYDMIFLDIYMDEISGVTAGKIIRNDLKDIGTEIVYISTSKEHFEEVFTIRAFDFIVKPLTEKKFGEVFKKIMEYYKNSQTYFYYTKNKVNKKIILKEVLYFEVKDKTVYIITNDSNISFASSMKEIQKKIDSKSFLQPHKSFLINSSFIQGFSYSEIYMNNGDIIPIGQKRRKEFRQLLMETSVFYDY